MIDLKIDSHDAVFRTKKSPYYIITNHYAEHSSGIRVTHSLCHILNNCGYESYVACTDNIHTTSHELWTPPLTDQVLFSHYLSGRKPIVIYPEIFGDQSVGLGLTVRYLLNKPGVISGGSAKLEGSDLLVAYKQEFAGEMDVDLLLTVPPCDPSIFHPSGLPDRERHGRYFYFNRLLTRGGSLSSMTEGAMEISPRIPRPLKELAEIFKRAELLYCYEWGAIAAEARMCGCPVVCVPDPQIFPSIDDDTFGVEGVAWGASEAAIANAKVSVELFYPRYLGMFESFRDQLAVFIERTQAAARHMDFEACFPREYIASRGWSQPDPWASVSDPPIASNQDMPQVPTTVVGLAKLLWKAITRRQ